MTMQSNTGHSPRIDKKKFVKDLHMCYILTEKNNKNNKQTSFGASFCATRSLQRSLNVQHYSS